MHRLQGSAGELRQAASQTSIGDPLDTVVNLALIGGAMYLTYQLFFGD